MSFKIPCGGFRLDEESFSLDENGVLSVSGGGGSGGGGIFVFDINSLEDSGYTTTATAARLWEEYEAGKSLIANTDVGIKLPLSAIYHAKNGPRFTFAGVNMYTNRDPFYITYTIDEDNVTKNDFSLTAQT